MTFHQDYPHISFKKRWDISESTAFLLGRCESMLEIIANTPIDPIYRQSLYTVSLRKGARATTAIEGNTLSDDEVMRIQQGQHLAPSKEYLEAEVLNILKALTTIRDCVIENNSDALVTPELLLSFHYMVGKDLGENFQATPGKFRASGENVTVGRYRAPDANKVQEMIEGLCVWVRREFNYENGQQIFLDKVVEAIVCHVYITWIHPFGDGNGRTARLVEFYLLLRAGLPDIASHILSNHYNDTREAYYRHLETATRENSLTKFINYAVQGFHDGLVEILNTISASQKVTIWENYIHSALDTMKVSGKSKAVMERQRKLALCLPTDTYISIEQQLLSNAKMLMLYQGMSIATIKRDMKALLDRKLVIEDNGMFKGNIELLLNRMPKTKSH